MKEENNEKSFQDTSLTKQNRGDFQRMGWLAKQGTTHTRLCTVNQFHVYISSLLSIC